MKNHITILLSLLLLCSCATTPVVTDSDTASKAASPSETMADAESETITETESETEPEIQSSANTEHLVSYHSSAIGSLLDRAFREEDYEAYLQWRETLPQEQCCDGYPVYENIYRFIRDFSIPREEYEEALYMEGEYYSTYVDLDILYNSTAEEASEAFSRPHHREWFDYHIDKEHSIKYALRSLIWDTAGTKDTWFQWQTEKGYDSYAFPHRVHKPEYMPNTWFSLTEIVHRFDISRADFEAIVERCGKYNGTTFDIDRIFDGYEELMQLQADEDLYPVEVDRLCWTGPAWVPGSEDDGSPEAVEIFPGDPEPPVEEVEVVPGADGEAVRGIDQIIYPE